MNIKEFLIDNYIYIIVVILLIIITIIGFLADKSKNKGSKQKKVAEGQPMPNNIGMQPINFQATQQPMPNPMNYQGMNQPMPNQQFNSINPMGGQAINFGQIPNTTVTPVNNQVNQNLTQSEIMQENVIPNAVPNQMISNMNTNLAEPNIENNSFNVPVTPVDNLNQIQVETPEPMYQPLSEQKPTFNKPEPMEEFNNQIPVAIPQNNMMNNPMSNYQSEPMTNSMPMNNIVAEPIQNNMNNNGFNIPNMESTINPSIMPMPQENINIMPQPIPNNNMNIPVQPMMNGMPANSNMMPGQPNVRPMEPVNTIPNPVTTPSPVQQGPLPVNFVYGPQQNNNQNM